MPLPKSFTPPPKTAESPADPYATEDDGNYDIRRTAIANAVTKRRSTYKKHVQPPQEEQSEVTRSEAYTPIVSVPENIPFYHQLMAGFEAQEGFKRENAEPDLLAFLGNDTLPYLSLVQRAQKDGLKTTEKGLALKTQILKMRIYQNMRQRGERRWFVPRPFGKNWLEYWSNPTRTVGWCLVGVGLFYWAYLTTEYAHDANNCRMLWNWLTYRCIIISWCRRNLEKCVNNAHLALGTLLFSKFLTSFFYRSGEDGNARTR